MSARRAGGDRIAASETEVRRVGRHQGAIGSTGEVNAVRGARAGPHVTRAGFGGWTGADDLR
jgi:hypothetical protein